MADPNDRIDDLRRDIVGEMRNWRLEQRTAHESLERKVDDVVRDVAEIKVAQASEKGARDALKAAGGFVAKASACLAALFAVIAGLQHFLG